MTAEGRCWRVSRDEATGIVRTVWLPGAVCGLGEARAVDAEIRGLVPRGILSLVDLRDVDTIDRPAREYFMGLNADYRATALLAGSVATRMLANFFIGLKRGSNPVRMFTSEAAAVSWLQAQP